MQSASLVALVEGKHYPVSFNDDGYQVRAYTQHIDSIRFLGAEPR